MGFLPKSASPFPRLALTPRDRLELEGGTLIVGAPRAGKSSSSYAAVLRAHLAAGGGGLVLIAHASEIDRILHLVASEGRQADLILFARQHHRFNFLAWGRQAGFSTHALTAMLMQAAETVGRSGASAAEQGDFWRRATHTMVHSAIELLTLARAQLSVHAILRLVTEAPDRGDLERPAWREQSFFHRVLEQARRRVEGGGSARARHNLRMAESYWLAFWTSLNDRTKTSIVSVYFALAGPLVYGDLHAMFNTGVSFDLTATHRGKLLLMDLPSETLGEGALYAQAIMKFCWQLATRRRPSGPRTRITGLFADEAELVATSSDIPFLAVCGNARATLTYVVHSVPEIEDKLGRGGGQALLSYFRTVIIHALSDPHSTRFCADLLGQSWQPQVTRTRTHSENFAGLFWLLWNAAFPWLAQSYSVSRGESVQEGEKYAYHVDPAAFTTLRNGGARHRFQVDAIVFQASKTWSTGANYLRITFTQDFARRAPLSRKLKRWLAGAPRRRLAHPQGR